MQDIQSRLRARLRRGPSLHSVPGSLPVLFFGDLFTARIATVGLNPSKREYLDQSGCELVGFERRFETLSSLQAEQRSDLTDEQCSRAIATMRGYYQPGKPVYSWFTALDRVTKAIGASYTAGEVCHLDLVQEATDPTWSSLKSDYPAEAQALLNLDLPFLRAQIEAFPLSAIVCNGRTVLDEGCGMLGAKVVECGHLERNPPGVDWTIATAQIAGRKVGVVGWNRPLSRPTGLGSDGERQLGKILASGLGNLGLL